MDGESFSLAGTAGASATRYTDWSLSEGTPYWYRLRAHKLGLLQRGPREDAPPLTAGMHWRFIGLGADQ